MSQRVRKLSAVKVPLKRNELELKNCFFQELVKKNKQFARSAPFRNQMYLSSAWAKPLISKFLFFIFYSSGVIDQINCGLAKDIKI